ncbi:MAG: hypothetical protein JWQ87_3864 [Candidatus Sulfotelmatobacter sp.]|nr:hypothetical protein [Candidatus Sulfotelmatobacter sp.]
MKSRTEAILAFLHVSVYTVLVLVGSRSALAAESYVRPMGLTKDTKTVPNKTVFRFAATDQNHCGQMEVVVVGLTKQSPNVEILGPSDVGTILTVPPAPGEAPTTGETCEITVPGTFTWQQVSARRSPTADAHSYQETTRKSDCGEQPDGSQLEPCPPKKPIPFPLDVVAASFTQPGAFQSSFKYSPGLHGAQDQISADIDFWPSLATKIGWLGVSARYRYDSRPNQNPDALISSFTLQERSKERCSWYSFGFKGGVCPALPFPCKAGVPCQARGPALTVPKPAPLIGLVIRPAQFDMRLVSLEYAPASAYANVVTSPRVSFPFVFTLMHQPSALTLTPSLGMDLGAHLSGALTPFESASVVRGSPGADSSLRIGYEKLTKYLDKKPITISARYRAYIPSHDEVLTILPSSAALPPTFILSSKTRHFAQANVSIPLTKYVSAGFSYLYGSLPPSFRQFDHNIQISITAQSQADYEH